VEYIEGNFALDKIFKLITQDNGESTSEIKAFASSVPVDGMKQPQLPASTFTTGVDLNQNQNPLFSGAVASSTAYPNFS
jgi:hypothetical protein